MNNVVMCPFCAAPIDLGTDPSLSRALVAHCYVNNKSCENKQWGSAPTRVDYADPEDRFDREGKPKVTHVLQLDPPESEDERKAREQREMYVPVESASVIGGVPAGI